MSSRLTRILKTFTFRLALVYVGLFGLSITLLFAFIYTFAANYMQAQISDAIRMQYTYLANEYRENGSSGVEARIKELIARNEAGNEIYLLVNKDYEKLAGNLSEWPANALHEGAYEKEGTWLRFHIEGTPYNPKGLEVKAISIPMSKWRYLLVGQTLQNNNDIEQTIEQTFWASLALTLLIAFAGAVVMTWSVMRRINVINRSAHSIMVGDLSTRIPFASGGDEFDELSANLNQMLDKIETLLHSLGEFANNIAHDLRSPLNRIITRLDDGLRIIEQDNPARNLLEKNITDMQELVGTFNSILKISELEATDRFRAFEPCDVQRILRKLVEFYEPAAAEKDIEMTSTIFEPLVINGEKNLLAQAFANLLDNALKFTPQGGKVSITSEITEGGAVITIADNGSGIPEAFRGKVFEKFFRLEQSRNTKGNGLGLSLVAAIARIHGIGISMEDNAPGLRVKLTIPASAFADKPAA